MTSDSKKTKADPAPKPEAAVKDNSTAVKEASKTEPASKTEAASKTEPAPKTDAGETAATPSNYSRGEGQKPVSRAYRENWNAIFAKNKTQKKKR